MENTKKPKRPRGRSPKEGFTEKVILAVDEATCVKLDALIEYGGFGTSRSQIVMFILRLWLRENHDAVKADIASKLTPFGSNNAGPT
jgi:hypothetical protein